MNTDIEQCVNGYWMPAGECNGKRAEVFRKRPRELGTLMDLMPQGRRRTVVQAGGHVGHYPQWLAAHFDRVVTYEPHPANFAAMVRNLKGDNILPVQAALGVCSNRGYKLIEHSHNSGGHYVRPGGEGEPVAVIRLDSFASSEGLDHVRQLDALILDVEGAELDVLLGAHDLLLSARPWLQLEQRGHIEGKVGIDTTADLEAYLRGLDYERAATVGHDVIWRPL